MNACSRIATRVPATPVVEAVHRREEIYHGPHASEGPDLLIETGRTVCMVEGLGQRAVMHAGRGPEERTGNHARDGILVLHGPDVRRGTTLPLAAIEDVAPTVLYLLGLPVDADMDGRVLTDALRARARGRRAGRGRGHAVRAARERFPLLRRGRETHPGHAGGTRLRMRARAAIFCLHDIVPDEHLAEVPATHRPYALPPDGVPRPI